ncbi:hypothetical protein [Aequorivita capsosiphonis]|uniref:hypothetical protein n=1 Tax=Aequorivita capsosiphonis TaxID=487317 RepID=UPI0004168F04|nr:hypothetical protein [Aequorivita capsosiphonis]
MEDNRIIKIFLDEDPKPFASFAPPVKIVLDTTKIPDGKHTLKIVAKSSNGIEGIREVPFVVRNGPSISVVGMKDNETVDTQVPLIINAYGSETKDFFVIKGSETPKAIPAWVWALLVGVIGYGLFYIIMYWSPELYKSFF